MLLDCRIASTADLDALCTLEHQCFSLDRLSPRSFHWMLTRANATLVVAEHAAGLAGYVLVLFHRGTSLARLYSIAVSPQWRGHGLGQRLLREAERCAQARDCVWLRLEVRPDNHAAIGLYEAHGYQRFAVLGDYYEDHAGAFRYEKRLLRSAPAPARRVPYYQQTTEFTCGAACLLMAMAALAPGRALAQAEEIQIWREATTVFMTAGHGGCSPQGLALAAWQRGFGVRLQTSHAGPLFLDGVRNPERKAIMRLVEHGFSQALAHTGVEYLPSERLDLRLALEAGMKPVVLISCYRLTRLKAPHWVVVTGCDEDFVYLHDPDVDHSRHRRSLDCQHIPVTHQEFQRMSSFGKQRVRAMVMLYAR